MAERRMFAKSIVDSDAFIEMPMSARLLYYDLGMRADDDGFVNAPKKIMKMIGATSDDMNILILRKFVIPFESGIVVIKHWRINNYLRKDTYHPTKYIDEFENLEIEENGSYHQIKMIDEKKEESKIEDNIQTQDEVASTKDELMQNLEPFLDHESSKDKRNDLKKTRELFDIFWSQYPRKQGRQKCLNWFEVHLPSQELVDTMIKAIYVQKQSDQWRKNNGMYIPMPITWLHQARWEDEMEISLIDEKKEESKIEEASEDEVQALLKEMEELDEQAKHGCD